MYISYETMNGCFLQWMLSFSILSRGNGCICPPENVLFFGLRETTLFLLAMPLLLHFLIRPEAGRNVAVAYT